MPIEGHANTKLCSKYKGIYGPYIHNNVGVFRGSPISALLSTLGMLRIDIGIYPTTTTYHVPSYTSAIHMAKSD